MNVHDVVAITLNFKSSDEEGSKRRAVDSLANNLAGIRDLDNVRVSLCNPDQESMRLIGAIDLLNKTKKFDLLFTDGVMTKEEAAGLSHMHDISSMRLLMLNGPEIGDDAIKYVKHWPRLEYLELNNTSITDNGLKYLRFLPALKTFHCWGEGCSLTGKSLATLGKVTSLEELVISDADFQGTTLQPLSNLIHLKKLSLADCNLSDKGLSELGEVTSLERLVISGADFQEANLQSLSNLVHLKELWLRDCNLSDKGLSELGKVTSLEELIISDADFQGTNLQSLSNLVHLKKLSLAGCNLSDKGLSGLENLSSLTTLKLPGNPQIKEASSSLFSKLPNLQYLNIARTGFQNEQIDLLRKKLPNTEIFPSPKLLSKKELIELRKSLLE